MYAAVPLLWAAAVGAGQRVSKVSYVQQFLTTSFPVIHDSKRRNTFVPQARSFERRRLVRVNAGWGAEPEWQPCTVADATKAAEGLVQLKLDIGALVDGYTKAGQCVQVLRRLCTKI